MGFIFEQNIFEQIKPINNLLIVSFLTLKSLRLPAEKCFRNKINGSKCFMKRVDKRPETVFK